MTWRNQIDLLDQSSQEHTNMALCVFSVKLLHIKGVMCLFVFVAHVKWLVGDAEVQCAGTAGTSRHV